MTIATDLLDAAQHDADVAASASAVTVRELHDLGDLRSVIALFDEIWQPESESALSTELMRAFAKADNYVVGAFDDDKLVGACVGFFAAPAHATLHSHIAGVSPSAGGRSIGYALKLHQRSWALRRGVGTIKWTFDPLVSRNAYFNLDKLGAHPVEYLPNFYGGMRDGINGDDDTDRLLLRWDLAAPIPSAGPHTPFSPEAEQSRGAVIALDSDTDGRPVAGRLDAARLLVAAPTAIEALRVDRPELAKHWRLAMRASLGALMAGGGVVTGFDRGGWYVVQRPQEALR